jgi:hypothetical protein
LIRLASLALGAFVAFNGITAVVGHRGDAVTWVSAAAVVLLGVAVWRVGVRFAGPRPQ